MGTVTVVDVFRPPSPGVDAPQEGQEVSTGVSDEGRMFAHWEELYSHVASRYLFVAIGRWPASPRIRDPEADWVARCLLDDLCPAGDPPALPLTGSTIAAVGGHRGATPEKAAAAFCCICLERCCCAPEVTELLSLLLAFHYRAPLGRGDIVPPVARTAASKYKLEQGSELVSRVAGRVSLFLTGEVRTMPCRHLFHRTCVDEWLVPRFDKENSRFDCPLCRAEVT